MMAPMAMPRPPITAALSPMIWRACFGAAAAESLTASIPLETLSPNVPAASTARCLRSPALPETAFFKSVATPATCC